MLNFQFIAFFHLSQVLVGFGLKNKMFTFSSPSVQNGHTHPLKLLLNENL